MVSCISPLFSVWESFSSRKALHARRAGEPKHSSSRDFNCQSRQALPWLFNI